MEAFHGSFVGSWVRVLSFAGSINEVHSASLGRGYKEPSTRLGVVERVATAEVEADPRGHFPLQCCVTDILSEILFSRKCWKLVV